MKLRLTVEAFSNLEAISDYIRDRNPAAADRVRNTILRSLEILAELPEAGRPQSQPGVRKLVTPRYSYLIYYKVDRTAEEIVVLSVRHHAQNRDYPDD